MRFELWLMGQNAKNQANYWELLKNTKWNKDRSGMPRYSVLEAILIEEPDFNNLDILTDEITNRAINLAEEIQDFIKKME